jgi:porin
MSLLPCPQTWRCTSLLLATAVVLSWALVRTLAQDNLSLESESQFPDDPRLFLRAQAEYGDMEDLSGQRLLGPLLRPGNGITVEPVYTGEVFTNAKGGISTKGATRYEALLDLSLTVDFEKLALPLPGRFFMLVQNTHGEGLSSRFIGDAQTISNIDSTDNIMQVSEYWWEVGLLDDRCTLRLGKQDVNTEFLVMDLAADFIHSAFGLSPSAGLPSYPNPSMAALLLADITDSLRLKVGVWDALSDGANWGISGNPITVTIGELEFKHTLLNADLPGAVDVGLAYQSAGDYLGFHIPSGYGCYVQVEQLVYRENDWNEEDPQGLGVFASFFPRFPNGPVPISGGFENDFVAGFVYKGLLPGRDADVIGAGLAWARLIQVGRNEEAAIDVFYKAQVTPSLSIQPDLQYIFSPSGVLRDALAAGARFQIAF